MRFIVILVFSCLFSQELEVEGDLKVTGIIFNDSLMQIISDLQAQITALQAQLVSLQGGVSQKVIDVTLTGSDDITTSLSEICPDYNLEWAIINIIDCPTANCYLQDISAETSIHQLMGSGNIGYYSSNENSSSFYTKASSEIKVVFFASGTFTIKLLVTAQFPN